MQCSVSFPHAASPVDQSRSQAERCPMSPSLHPTSASSGSSPMSKSSWKLIAGLAAIQWMLTATPNNPEWGEHSHRDLVVTLHALHPQWTTYDNMHILETFTRRHVEPFLKSQERSNRAEVPVFSHFARHFHRTIPITLVSRQTRHVPHLKGIQRATQGTSGSLAKQRSSGAH